jgi:hypothetical protein
VKRTTSILTIASLVGCILFLVLLPVSELLSLPFFTTHGDAIDPHASFSIGIYHCGISRGGIWFFNDELPYTGSIIGFEGQWGGKKTTDRTDWSWVFKQQYGIEQVSHIDESGQSAGMSRYGDFPGIYYRHFEWWRQTLPWWTLRVSLWYPITLFAMLPVWWSIRRLRRRRTTSEGPTDSASSQAGR